MVKDPVFLEEEHNLSRTREQFDRIAEENQEFFEKLPWLYPNESEIIMLNELLTSTHNRIVKLRRGKSKPYFARIDFTPGNPGSETSRYYLGKIGVLDREEAIVTLDWRAPIATLYYDSGVGPVTYETPVGEESGSLELKRQLEIEDGRLLSWNDVDTVSNDELLRPYLGVNADNRLKNIISTIQAEQNRIIRERLNVNLIVQGAAGSGKTTVALHRIAYLAYTYRDSIKPKQYMVIGPNRFFISYISSVLPDLDVDSVPQLTYPELVKDAIQENFSVTEASDKLALVIAGKSDGNTERIKASMAYKDALDRFLAWYQQTLAPDHDLVVKDFPVLSREDMLEAWDSAVSGPGSTIKARIGQCVLYIQSKLEARNLLLEQRLSDYFRALYQDKSHNLDKLHRDRAYLEKELEKGWTQSLKGFFSKSEGSVLAVYRLFVQNCEQFLNLELPQLETFKKHTLAGLRKKRLDPEDLPALLYLLDRIRGTERYAEFRHAVIDEAQDLGEFDFYALQRVMKNSTFTAVGDLAQSIYNYRGVEGWENVISHSFQKGASLQEMFKSYRTTVEIMQAANHVTDALGIAPATPVIRHGKPVSFHKAKGEDALKKLCYLVREHLNEEYQSIALLAKTPEALEPVCRFLNGQGIPVEIATTQSGQYTGGVCAMPGYLSKGLEFDAVILCDASDKVYRADQRIDMHLLYVEMTRPLHRLDIFYDETVAAPLAGLVNVPSADL